MSTISRDLEGTDRNPLQASFEGLKEAVHGLIKERNKLVERVHELTVEKTEEIAKTYFSIQGICEEREAKVSTRFSGFGENGKLLRQLDGFFTIKDY